MCEKKVLVSEFDTFVPYARRRRSIKHVKHGEMVVHLDANIDAMLLPVGFFKNHLAISIIKVGFR